MLMFLLGIEGWKFVFSLLAASEVGGGILLRLLALNSIKILILAVEREGPSFCNACVGSVTTRFVWVLIY
jgi:hypothetical protein